MRKPRSSSLYAIAFTGTLTLLVASAVGVSAPWLGLAVVIAGVGCFSIFDRTFPGSRAFAIGLSNGLAVYACLYVYLLEANFAPLEQWIVALGFLLPVLGFLLGATWRRHRIEGIVTSSEPHAMAHPGRLFFWLLPMVVVGVVGFAVPALDLGQRGRALALLASMASIAVAAGLLSTRIAVFLLDSALLFEQLLRRMGRLVTAAFAFLTFYSLLVIVFGAIYRVLDLASSTPHFAVGGVVRDLNFPEALYFSLVTLATLGYGDVVPVAAAARVLVAIQTVVGLLLLLFGFAEIQRALRERGEHSGG